MTKHNPEGLTTYARIVWPAGSVGIPQPDWDLFTEHYGFELREGCEQETWAIGQRVAVIRAQPSALLAGRVHFVTGYMSRYRRDVARYALTLWKHHGGALDASPEIADFLKVFGGHQ